MKKSLFKVLSTIVTIFVTITSLTPQYFATGSVFTTDGNGNLSATITNQYNKSNSAYMLTLKLTKTFEYSNELNEDTLTYFENFKNKKDFSNIFEIQRSTPTDETNWEDFVDFEFVAGTKLGEKGNKDSKTYSIEYTLKIYSAEDNSQYSFRVREKDLSKISDIKDSFSSDNMCKEDNEDVWVEFESDPAAPNDVKTALITNTHIPGQNSDISVQIKYGFSADGNIIIGASGNYELDGKTLTVPKDTETYKLDAIVNLKDAPSVSGYSFDGWRLDGSTEKLGASFRISQDILNTYAVLSDDFNEETNEPADEKPADAEKPADGEDDSKNKDKSGKPSGDNQTVNESANKGDTGNASKPQTTEPTYGVSKSADGEDNSGSSDLNVSLLPLKNTAYLSVQDSSSNKVYILALVGSYSENLSPPNNSSNGFVNVQNSNPNEEEDTEEDDVKKITVNFIHKYFSLDENGKEISDGEYKSTKTISSGNTINIKDHIKNTFKEVKYQYKESDPEFDNNTLTFDQAKELTNNGKKELTITLIYKIANGNFSWDKELNNNVGGETIAEDVAEENLESGDIDLISDDTVNTGKYMFIIPFIAIIAAAVYAIAFMNKKTF